MENIQNAQTTLQQILLNGEPRLESLVLESLIWRASSGEPRPGEPHLESLVLESLVGSWRPDVRQQRSLREPRFSYTFSYYSAPGEPERRLRIRG
jgi:hypothetical protein